jgi:hypothetical protein
MFSAHANRHTAAEFILDELMADAKRADQEPNIG